MNTELPSPHGEHIGAPGSGEIVTAPNQYEAIGTVQSVEINATERGANQEARTGAGAGDAGGSVQQSAVTTTIAADQPIVPTPPPVSLDDVPVVAADEDLIEKQWVDSAKRIIKETRSDPYQQSEALRRLQADYLQKRYGRSLAEGGV